MKTSRFQFQYRENASKLHRTVGELLRSSESLGLQEIYQEYPVSRINTNYQNNSHHLDWAIPKLGIVFECHGKQHYTPVAFDGNVDKAVADFRDLQRRDREKKEAVLAGDFTYVEIPYHLEKSLDEAKLLELIQVGKEELAQYTKDHEGDRRLTPYNEVKELTEVLKEKQRTATKEARKRHLASSQHQDQLAAAREYRQKQYRRLKEFKNGTR